MKNLVLVASVSRMAGGLFESVRCLSQSLQVDQGVDVEVLGMEDLHTREDVRAWLPLTPRTFPAYGPRKFGFSPGLGRALEEASPDVVHTHGLWMYPSVAAIGQARLKRFRRVVSVHGMLDSWAVRNSYWRKRIAGLIYENRHLRESACIRSLCKAETKAIREYGLTNPICVIPNGINLPERKPSGLPPWAGKAPLDAGVLLYLGRIHPKKGLTNLIHAFARVQKDDFPAARGWYLAISGWDQGGHEKELHRIAADAGARNIVFLGPQFGEAKKAAYANANAFILPSFSEGLPMVVLEAWAYGLPVIMTPQCNIPEGFGADAAIRIDPTASGIMQGLRILFEMNDDQRSGMGARGFALVREQFTWKKISGEIKAVYDWTLGGGVPPESVVLDQELG